MGSGTSMTQQQGRDLAEQVRALVDRTPDPLNPNLTMPAVHRWEVAGSLRRGRQTIGDLEIVAMSTYWYGVNVLNLALDHLLETGKIEKALKGTPPKTTTRWGDKYRAFTIAGGNGAHVEIFQADILNWGAQLAIRTGAYQFGRMCMTKMKDYNYNMEDGYLHFNRKRIPCPDEATFFKAAGFSSVPEPHTREYDDRDGGGLF